SGSFIWFVATPSLRRNTACRMPSHHFSTIAPAFAGTFCSSHEETNRSSAGESVTIKAFSEAASPGRKSLSRIRTRGSPSGTFARISRQFCWRRKSRAVSSRSAKTQSMEMSCRGAGAFAPDERVRIFAHRHFSHAHNQVVLEQGVERTFGGFLACCVGVKAKHNFVDEALQDPCLALSERRALGRDDIRDSRFKQTDQI